MYYAAERHAGGDENHVGPCAFPDDLWETAGQAVDHDAPMPSSSPGLVDRLVCMTQARWHGATVAVKILRQADEAGLGDFRTELNVLQKVRRCRDPKPHLTREPHSCSLLDATAAAAARPQPRGPHGLDAANPHQRLAGSCPPRF